MADLAEVLALVKQIREELPGIIQRAKVQAEQIVIGEGLSDISKRLGVITAGEFRSGNGIAPGLGFSGVRIAYPPLSYSGALWNIAGVNNDIIQFGLDAATGKAIAGGGVVTLDLSGITFEVGTLATDVASAIKWNQSGVEQFRIIGWVNSAINTNQFWMIMNRITGKRSVMVIGVDSVTETISGSPSSSAINLLTYKDGTAGAGIILTSASSSDNSIDIQTLNLTILDNSTDKLGFFGTAAVAKQTVTGSRGGNAALASLLTALAAHGLITNSTT